MVSNWVFHFKITGFVRTSCPVNWPYRHRLLYQLIHGDLEKFENDVSFNLSLKLSCTCYHLPRFYWVSTIFYVIDLLIIITKQKKHQLEIHETAIKRGKYLFRGKFNVMSGQMTLKHQLLDNWHGQGVSHFKIHQYTIYIFKPRSFKAPSVWVSVSSKSQSPRLSISCIQLML